MAKNKQSLVGFDKALVHMKEGRKAIREEWGRDYTALRIDDTGLGLRGEFMRIDSAGRQNRYPLATEDVLATDWKLI